MSFEKIRKTLSEDTPGRSTELNYFRIGPSDAPKKVYLQAALHADEQPGILILHHLVKLLRDADDAGELDARFVVFPMVNPLGMGDIGFLQHQGRYNRVTGVNHNRGWPVLYDALDEGLADRLGDDAAENVAMLRAELRAWADGLPTHTALEQWRQCLLAEACDADYVFDLHCDDDALLYIYTLPQLQGNMWRLAGHVGAAATMTAEDSGGGSFDEVWPAIWLRLARERPDKPLPLPVVSCTLEYRGQADTADAVSRDDALNLFGYFQAEGLIGGKARGRRGEAPEPSDLRATEILRAPRAGLLVYRAALGERVEKGDCVAELLILDGEGAFVERLPLLAGTSGTVISFVRNKYVWRNAGVAKIVGREILESRGEYLLGD